MKFVMFYHSLVSDWNHGNAHFLRGVATELIRRGHQVEIFEPRDGWSRMNLLGEHGNEPVEWFHAAYPELESHLYDADAFDPEPAVRDADVVIVHEWNSPELVGRFGKLRRRHDFTLLFHDTHHRMVTDPEAMQAYDLSGYDGVLAFGDVLRRLYLQQRRAKKAWTWHEAADVRIFQPYPEVRKDGDLVWIGNWGDGERAVELQEFLIEPVRELRLKARVYGVRYPAMAREALERAGIEYRGWLPNFHAPMVFARFRATIHVPRRAYAGSLPGIPTIRPFEAMACGIPLISAPWEDVEGLFEPGRDFSQAANGTEMKEQLMRVIADEAWAKGMAGHGLATIRRRHTCAHRVDELLAIQREVTRGIREASVL
jgi:spore maturation protein CgeB